MLLAFCIFVIIKTHKAHDKRSKEVEDEKIYNLRKIKSASASRAFTFKHMGYLLKEIRESLDITFDALFAEDVNTLRIQKKKTKQIQKWVNIITANIFKVLRLQQQKDEIVVSYKYAQTIRRLQKLSDGHRDIVLRSYVHVSNHHKGLLPVQITELKEVKESIFNILSEVEETFERRQKFTQDVITEQLLEIKSHADHYHFKQIERIQDETSKTRLSILFYAIVGNCMMLGKQNLKLLEIFEESFPVNNDRDEV